MNKIDIYKIWAPTSLIWSSWVRPVPFIDLDIPKTSNVFIDYEIPSINYSNELDDKTAIIIDESGPNSIKEGIALALKGYQPIPLFNGTNPNQGTIATTDNDLIEPFLIWGALELSNITLKENALPVFLLDKNRLNRYKMNSSIFDNSWDIFPQDIPSYKFLLEHNIDKILIKSDKLNKDLEKVLYKYYKNGIKILFTNGYDEIKEIKIKKPKKIEL